MELRKIKNNKGLSLIELLVAITLFAIVITPIMNSFMTSLRINKNSREYMAATDTAQTIIEGFSEMTYETIAAAVDQLETKDLGGSVLFTTFNEGKYNVSANYINLNKTTAFADDFADVTPYGFKFMSADYANIDIVSNNAVTHAINDTMLRAAISTGAFAGQTLAAAKIPVKEKDSEGHDVETGDGMIFMIYSNLESKTGYKYNAAVTIMPSATDNNPLSGGKYTKNYYLTYNIKVTLYHAEDFDGTSFGNPTVSLLGGVSGK